ncbi:MAG TPA: hypothetical protein DD490_25540 [Acidobacteria bacterium]|nr:hypothetical protein [Acidobacteriota bacterium]
MTAPPLCTTAAQLGPLDGRWVRLVGTYLPVPTLKKMPRPGAPREELDLGQVVIELAGDAPARIALGTTIRPGDEIARFRHRRVAVEGRLVLAPVSQVPEAAAPRPAPVLLDPSGLRLAE